MQVLSTTPYWVRTGPLPSLPVLDGDLTVDVAVIGGGLVGMTTAYLLSKAGLTTAVLERERIAAIDTGHTTAHVTMVTDEPLTELVKHFGSDTATAVWDAGRLAIDQIEAIVDAEGIRCDFRRVPGFLHLALSGPGLSRDELREQADLASELGFKARFDMAVKPFGLAGARFEQQALFHPRRYIGGLLEAVKAAGAHVFEHSAVDEVIDSPLGVRAGRHRVTCDYLVIATHTPLMGKTDLVSATLLQSKLALYTSYALGGRLPAGEVPAGLYWDTADPYHYLRVEPHDAGDFFVFGGGDHKTGTVSDTHNCYTALERTLRKILPAAEVTDRWSGQVIETTDGLPYIGETADRQFVATGFAGNGMTFGSVAAMMARDAVLERANPWRELFDPGRTSVRAGAWNYVRENKDYLFYLIRDHLVAPHGRSLRGIRPGSGKVIDLNGRRVAAYRDPHGVMTLRSAVCTHMACEVHWNQAESTWDCPCHGSRFKPDGSVLAGPAESPLPPID